VVLFDNANELTNKSVTVGERIMEIARPGQFELEIRLPMGNAINFAPKAKTTLFPDIDPLHKIPAQLSDISYNVVEEPGGDMIYRLTAQFLGNRQNLKIGMRGTAKIFGKQVTLFYYLFRRPLTASRQWLGL
jgi:hypothetical protein